MRKRLATVRSLFGLVVLTLAVVSPALAGPVPGQVAAAQTEAAVLPSAEPAGLSAGGPRSDSVDFRESAALVLVGTMLIGLAAAVRRTA